MSDTRRIFHDDATQAAYERNLIDLRLIKEEPAWALARVIRARELEDVAKAARKADEILYDLQHGANDGEFDLWSQDDLLAALFEVRSALNSVGGVPLSIQLVELPHD